jgi:hypothetical protein
MTSFDRDHLLSRFHGNAPVGAAEIEQFERESGFKLPIDYIAFLQRSDGGEGFVGPNQYIIFWRLGELAAMNKAYEVEKFAPGLFLFGSDGGGEAYAFDTRTSAVPIVFVPFVGMEPSLAQVVASTFEGLLQELSKA